jgi:hypothetical protein
MRPVGRRRSCRISEHGGRRSCRLQVNHGRPTFTYRHERRPPCSLIRHERRRPTGRIRKWAACRPATYTNIGYNTSSVNVNRVFGPVVSLSNPWIEATNSFYNLTKKNMKEMQIELDEWMTYHSQIFQWWRTTTVKFAWTWKCRCVVVNIRQPKNEFH